CKIKILPLQAVGCREGIGPVRTDASVGVSRYSILGFRNGTETAERSGQAQFATDLVLHGKARAQRIGFGCQIPTRAYATVPGHEGRSREPVVELMANAGRDSPPVAPVVLIAAIDQHSG